MKWLSMPAATAKSAPYPTRQCRLLSAVVLRPMKARVRKLSLLGVASP